VEFGAASALLVNGRDQERILSDAFAILDLHRRLRGLRTSAARIAMMHDAAQA
jgi:hypothetical protein